MKIAKKTLKSIVENVFLPPKRPQRAPADSESREEGAALLSLARDVANEYHKQAVGLEPCKWQIVLKMLTLAYKLQGGKSLSKADFMTAMNAMQCGGM